MNDIELKKIKDVEMNERPTMALKFQNVQIKKTTSNCDYASLIGYDGTDLIDVKIWSLPKEKKDILKSGDIYIASGSIKDYQGKKQFNVADFRIANPDEVDLSSFYEYAPLTDLELKTKISGYINRIENDLLKKIVLAVIKKYVNEYFSFPAAVSVHHNYISGLAYHVYSMLSLSDGYLKLYSNINKDLVYAGIILHDIGKVKELSGNKGTEYTKAGNLLGHISIGSNMIYNICIELQCENSEEALMLQHIVLSHHGLNEYGSPKEPLIPEAALIYLLDFSDSRMAALSKACIGVEKGDCTDPITAFDRRSFYIPNIK